MDVLSIFIYAVLINNVVLSQFLGICPFLGVSQRLSTSIGMGAAVIFVMTLANFVTYFIYYFILTPLELHFMQTITFILVIASLVQIVEIIMKKVSPPLYRALGIYLPLITTNCAVLGTAILSILKSFNLFYSLIYAVSTAIGFTLALIIMAGIREQLELVGIPKKLQGFPITLILAGLISLAFMGFAGLIKL